MSEDDWMHEPVATLRLYDEGLDHIVITYADPDVASDLYEWLIEHPPTSVLTVELSGGPFSFHQRKLWSTPTK